jgi:hypothetical protein
MVAKCDLLLDYISAMKERYPYRTEGNLTMVDFGTDPAMETNGADVLSVCWNIKRAAQLCDQERTKLKDISHLIYVIQNQVEFIELDTGQVPQFEVSVPWGADSCIKQGDQIIEKDPIKPIVTELYAMTFENARFYNRITRQQLEISGHVFEIWPLFS